MKRKRSHANEPPSKKHRIHSDDEHKSASVTPNGPYEVSVSSEELELARLLKRQTDAPSFENFPDLVHSMWRRKIGQDRKRIAELATLKKNFDELRASNDRLFVQIEKMKTKQSNEIEALKSKKCEIANEALNAKLKATEQENEELSQTIDVLQGNAELLKLLDAEQMQDVMDSVMECLCNIRAEKQRRTT